MTVEALGIKVKRQVKLLRLKAKFECEFNSSQGVEGSRGRVIREPELDIFYYNGNFDLAFQSEEEFHLASIAQLIRIKDGIPRGTPEAEEMFKKMEMAIEARDDVIQARKIVQDNLDGLGM
ncbi:hypothetical protein Tco_1018811 [Tanacetum coccineum]|uniref:Uncharacterized protein n=1 Tax=Tanacetum coccineum TaxID=301880 RepID=A0ABQ5FVD3_9ASTR